MIDLSKSDGIWTLRLDRPAKANALTLEMLECIAEVAQEAVVARALIITGTGRVSAPVLTWRRQKLALQRQTSGKKYQARSQIYLASPSPL